MRESQIVLNGWAETIEDFILLVFAKGVREIDSADVHSKVSREWTKSSEGRAQGVATVCKGVAEA
jgi:hypothetical protein